MSNDAVNVELERIAATIRKLVSGSKEVFKTSYDFPFSTSANQIISAAGSLGLSTNRGRITASCLLFALADTDTPTSQFVREQLDKQGLYKAGFDKFVGSGRPSDSDLSFSGAGPSVATLDAQDSAGAMADRRRRAGKVNPKQY